jgi:hypothetical protein
MKSSVPIRIKGLIVMGPAPVVACAAALCIGAKKPNINAPLIIPPVLIKFRRLILMMRFSVLSASVVSCPF